jgi:putative oxidoreductase
MQFDSIWSETAGRVLIVLSFVVAGFYNIVGRENHIVRLSEFNVPYPTFAFWFGMVIQYLGCFLIITRWHTDFGALCRIVFSVTATLIYHRFWTKDDPRQRAVSRITMISNVAIVGGLLLLVQG